DLAAVDVAHEVGVAEVHVLRQGDHRGRRRLRRQLVRAGRPGRLAHLLPQLVEGSRPTTLALDLTHAPAPLLVFEVGPAEDNAPAPPDRRTPQYENAALARAHTRQ